MSRELVESYFIIKVGDMYLSEYSRRGNIEFNELDSNANKFIFVEGLDYTLDGVLRSYKEDVVKAVIDVTFQLNQKGFIDTQIIEKRIYREEKEAMVSVRIRNDGKVELR